MNFDALDELSRRHPELEIVFLESGGGVRRAYPPATLKRLAQVKRRYDPDNLFHLNLNVAPATLPGQRRRREAQ
jgi:hypothetical protein